VAQIGLLSPFRSPTACDSLTPRDIRMVRTVLARFFFLPLRQILLNASKPVDVTAIT